MENNNNAELKMVLPEQFTIAAAADVCEILLDFLDKPDCAVIDGSEVQRADAAAMQVMASFCKTAEKSHLEFEIHKPSDVFMESWQICGLDKIWPLN